MAAKTFPTLHVASCLTGIGMSDKMSYSDIQAIASHLFGASIWTHELVHAPTQDAYKSEGYRQFPDMPTPAEASADFEAAARKATAAYGETVTVEEGTHGRREHPVDTLAAMVSADKIIVVEG
jgi:hypothetical protein